jgi:alanine or glycine:cation symporter, AGCS family
MNELNNFLSLIDNQIGGSQWFVFLLLGTGLFFTIYLKFPQFRYLRHSVRIVMGKFDKKGDEGDTSHFQALTTALSGTVGTGNIAGVALAIHLGGPAALFWMLVTAAVGMTTKFVEVTLSHKYREKAADGSIAGGPMYYMRSRLNIQLKNKKVIKTGAVMGALFAAATIFSSLAPGTCLKLTAFPIRYMKPSDLNHVLTGAVLSVLLALVILGGIKRIAWLPRVWYPLWPSFILREPSWLLLLTTPISFPALWPLLAMYLPERLLLAGFWAEVLLLHLTGA